MQESVEKLLKSLSLEEKCALLSGADAWSTGAPGEVPTVHMNDGPHGVRKAVGMFADAVPATCFPTLASLACTWDRASAADIGGAIGSEAASMDVDVILAPGVNIKRSPLGGRNFEYFSEDPYLAGQMAAQYVKGMQSQGVGAALKHFALNSQETRRMSVSAEVDERCLREIYLSAFETVVKEASPWTVMCAYNRLNGVFCSENRRLLTEILREEWGFDGLVMSDWGAVVNRAEGVRAGLDLEMPGPAEENTAALVSAVREGGLSEEDVDICAARVIELALKCAGTPKALPQRNSHMATRRCAAEGMVLAKNDGGLLPLIPAQRVALIGPFGMNPVIGGGGSSDVNPTRVDVPLEEMRVYDPPVFYAQGFRADGKPDGALFDEALATAAKADVVVVMVGLSFESQTEGEDRKYLGLPEVQNRLVDALCEAHKNVAVVVNVGAPVELPWADRPSAILLAYPGGQGMGGAIADVLYGIKEPGGRLAETWPVKLEDTPCYLDFPGGTDSIRYGEGVFVGYRWYDGKKLAPLFPFGHGLSYTTFTYTDMVCKQDGNDIEIELRVTNTGSRVGRTVVQLYVAPKDASPVPRPVQELKGFEKLRLSAGESAKMTFRLDVRSFSYYDVNQKGWAAEPGVYEVRLGTSSRSVFFRQKLTIPGTGRSPYTVHSLLSDLLSSPAGAELRRLLQESDTDISNPMVASTPLRALPIFSKGAMKRSDCDRILKLANGDYSGQ